MRRKRYFRITWFFARVIIHLAVFDIFLNNVGFKNYITQTRHRRLRNIAVKFRELAVEMGGVLIKVGQFLSTRVDVLPGDITEELSGLQDEVQPETFEAIKRVAEEDLGYPLGQIFTYFNPIPSASASLGQVHSARCKFQNEGFPIPDHNLNHYEIEEPEFNVVVKIQRPEIEQIITTDLAAIKTVGAWLQHYKPIRRRADVTALIREFERVLYEEIDYLSEGRNIEVFSGNFIHNNYVRVPKVFWSHTTRKVLTMEDVGGIKIDHYIELEEAGIDRHEVAEILLKVYFQQIFEDGFFHADPHPGNIFVTKKSDEEGTFLRWELSFVDFGMVGRITSDTRRGLQEALIAFATRDSKKLVHAYQMLNILLPDAELELIHKADAIAFDRFWGKNMSELKEISPEEFRKLLGDFRELIFQLPFQLPQNLIFLARAIGLLSGLCTGLDPEFNVFDQIVPYAQKFLQGQKSKNFGSGLKDELIDSLSQVGILLQKTMLIPGLTYSVLEKIDQGNIVVHDPKSEKLIQKMVLAERKLIGAVLFLAFFLGFVQLYIGGEVELSILSGIASIVTIAWMAIIKDK